MERRAALETPEAAGWSKRAALAAEFLGFARSVADLGCGTMTLERYLSEGTRYVPVDVCRRDERTIVCDFNVDPTVDNFRGLNRFLGSETSLSSLSILASTSHLKIKGEYDDFFTRCN